MCVWESELTQGRPDTNGVSDFSRDTEGVVNVGVKQRCTVYKDSPSY